MATVVGISENPAIVSLEEVQTYLGETQTTAEQDEQLRLFADAATTIIENEIGPVLPRELTHTTRRWGAAILRGRIASITSIVAGDHPVTGYEYDAEAGVVLDLPAGSVITYVAGFEDVPQAIRLAALYAIQHAWEGQQGAVTGGQAGTDEVFVVSRGFFLPDRAKELLAPYLQPQSVV